MLASFEVQGLLAVYFTLILTYLTYFILYDNTKNFN